MANKNIFSDKVLKAVKVRCSFPHLFEEPVINNKKASRSCTFLFDKNDKEHLAQLKAIKAEMQVLADQHDKLDGNTKKADGLCVRDGDEMRRPEYEGHYVLKANAQGKPAVFNRRKELVTQDDSPIYAGCYVDGSFTLWVQDNEHGLRINASLRGVRYREDGEPLEGGVIDPDEVRDEFADEEDDDDKSGGSDDIDF